MMVLSHSPAVNFIDIKTESCDRKIVSLIPKSYNSYKTNISFILGHPKETWEQLETEPSTENYQYCCILKYLTVPNLFVTHSYAVTLL